METPPVTISFQISDAVKQIIDAWVAKYPVGQQRSAVLESLLLVQEQNGGWLSDAAMQAVADYLNLPPVAVYEVATFYDMYNLEPIGKYKISICTNVSCMLNGSEEIISALKNRLGIGLGETSANGMFTLKEVECMAACGGAPMCQINDRDYHENLTPAKMIKIIDQIECNS